MDPFIPVCIVDDHCDIIAFLHALWKKKAIPFNGLYLCHVDAHPDLSINSTCTTVNFNKLEYLYDLLDTSEGAISEFILPMFANEHFDEMVYILALCC